MSKKNKHDDDTPVATRKPKSRDDVVTIRFPNAGPIASAIFTLEPEASNGSTWELKCTNLNGMPVNLDAEGGIELLFSKDPNVGPLQVCTLTINIKTDDDEGVWTFSQMGADPFGLSYCKNSDFDVINSVSTVSYNHRQSLKVTLVYPLDSSPIGTNVMANFAFVATLTEDGKATQYVSKDPQVSDGDD